MSTWIVLLWSWGVCCQNPKALCKYGLMPTTVADASPSTVQYRVAITALELRMYPGSTCLHARLPLCPYSECLLMSLSALLIVIPQFVPCSVPCPLTPLHCKFEGGSSNNPCCSSNLISFSSHFISCDDPPPCRPAHPKAQRRLNEVLSDGRVQSLESRVQLMQNAVLALVLACVLAIGTLVALNSKGEAGRGGWGGGDGAVSFSAARQREGDAEGGGCRL